ncbi:MAG: MlaD family protein [Syntrophobacteraceae bacterium]
MPRTVSAFRIGIFALVCGTISAAALLWLGVYSHFQDTRTYAAYFSESVKGLQKDAVVNYRGVAVGRVESIGLAPDGRLIEVLVKLKSDFRVDLMVAMQLREQGLTGLSYLEIDTAPENIESLTPRIAFPTKYPILRTYPSEISQLKFALQDIYEKFSRLDLKGLTETWTRTAELVNNLLVQFGASTETGDLKETISSFKKTAQSSAALMERLDKATSQEGMTKGFADLSATLASTRQASENLARQLAALPPDELKRLSLQLDETLKSGGTLFSGLSKQLGESTSLLEQNLQQLKVLLFQVNALVQGLKEQPNRLVFPSKQQPDPFDKKK